MTRRRPVPWFCTVQPIAMPCPGTAPAGAVRTVGTRSGTMIAIGTVRTLFDSFASNASSK
jgi:hypothetical protein